MRKLALSLLAAILFSGAALAQVTVVPGSPAQVNRALAEAPGTWADDAVELLVSRGIYIGYPDGSFGWRDDITRAEMALVIARLISSFDLESFDPDEMATLRLAVEQLSEDLAGLAQLVEQHDQQLGEVADALVLHEQELEDLWAAIQLLDVAPAVFDATDLWLATGELESAAAGREAELSSLRDRVEALEAAEVDDTGDLRDRLAALEAGLAEAAEERAQLADGLADLRARVASLEGQEHLLTELELRIGGTADRLALLEARVSDLEAALAGVNVTLADHEERISRLEATLLPERAPFHISVALYGSAPDGGLVGQVAIGHDAVAGNMGVRVSADFGFSEVPFSIAGAATYRATMDNVDGYAGLGLGVSFEEAGNAIFAEILVGISYRIARNIGVYGEARFRPYFDGSGDGLAAIGGGVQLRF